MNRSSEYFGQQTEVLRPVIPFVLTSYSSLTCHLDLLLGDTFLVDLLAFKYLLGAPVYREDGSDYSLYLPYKPPLERPAVLWRYAKGNVVDGNVMLFDEDGNILSWKEIFENDSCDRYWHKEILKDDNDRYYKLKGFFGGHLLDKAKNQYIFVTHTEIQAMLGYLWHPEGIWLAIGYRQHLTYEHQLLLNDKKNVFFIPDKEMLDDIHNIGILKGMKCTKKFINGEENDPKFMEHCFLNEIGKNRQHNQAIFEKQYQVAKEAHRVMTRVN
ncbi:MAG: DUF6371 domain-containing protein [Prevotella sp.]|nr:DUF6371 domain-containing protein [Prevotella sp.]